MAIVRLLHRLCTLLLLALCASVLLACARDSVPDRSNVPGESAVPAQSGTSASRLQASDVTSVDGVPLGSADQEQALPGTRFHAASRWDTMWTRRGSFDDTMLIQPSMLLAIDSLVIVVDFAERNVKALDAYSGMMRWTAGRSGRGPREFSRLHLFDGGEGRIGIADVVNQRLSYLSSSGEFVGEERVALTSDANGLCHLSGALFVQGFVPGLLRLKPGLLRRSPTSDTLLPLHAPWLEYLDTLDVMRGQYSLHRINDKLCAMLPAVGPYDMLVFDADLNLAARVLPREQIPVAQTYSQPSERGGRMTRLARGTQYGWEGLAVADGSAFAVFGGASELRGRLIDEFALRDMKYVGTHLAPYPVRFVAGSQDRLTVLMNDTTGYFVISQLRRTTVP